eukprot:gnl/Chilomastix_cuspidata/1685.p2 GENE.gnl/Chilomastix_cuspidata/1685~~gnl/Chilomastix_cuspidata/1685.p2  ORF type:complete len:1130 (+),score=552.19 gnl/Chilomastix_cuspidata/1685:523-3912(+)
MGKIDQLIPGLRGKDIKKRYEAVQNIQTELESLSSEDEIESIDDLFFALRGGIDDNNYRVSETSMRCIILLDQHFPDFIPTHNPTELAKKHVLEKLGDMHSPARDAASDLILCLMSAASAQKGGTGQFLKEIGNGLAHKNWRVRQGIVQSLHRALDTFGSEAVDWMKHTVPRVIDSLQDSNGDVREALQEFLVALFAALGAPVRARFQRSSVQKAIKQAISARFEEIDGSAPSSAAASDDGAAAKDLRASKGEARRGTKSLSASFSRSGSQPPKKHSSGSLFPPAALQEGLSGPPTWIYGRDQPRGTWLPLTEFALPPPSPAVTRGDVVRALDKATKLAQTDNWKSQMAALHELLALAMNADIDEEPVVEAITALSSNFVDFIKSRRTTLSRECCLVLELLLFRYGMGLTRFAHTVLPALLDLMKMSGVFCEGSADAVLRAITVCAPPKNFLGFLVAKAGSHATALVRAHLLEIILLFMDAHPPAAWAPKLSAIGDVMAKAATGAMPFGRRIGRIGCWFIRDIDAAAGQRLLDKFGKQQLRAAEDDRSMGLVPARGQLLATVPGHPDLPVSQRYVQAVSPSASSEFSPRAQPSPRQRAPPEPPARERRTPSGQARRRESALHKARDVLTHVEELGDTAHAFGGAAERPPRSERPPEKKLRTRTAPERSGSFDATASRESLASSEDRYRRSGSFAEPEVVSPVSDIRDAIQELAASDWSQRLSALKALRATPSETLAAIAAPRTNSGNKLSALLGQRISDTHFKVAVECITLLGEWMDFVAEYLERFLPALLAQLYASKAQVKNAASATVRKILLHHASDPAPLVPALGTALEAQSPKTRDAALSIVNSLEPSSPLLADPGRVRHLAAKVAPYIVKTSTNSRQLRDVAFSALLKLARSHAAAVTDSLSTNVPAYHAALEHPQLAGLLEGAAFQPSAHRVSFSDARPAQSAPRRDAELPPPYSEDRKPAPRTAFRPLEQFDKGRPVRAQVDMYAFGMITLCAVLQRRPFAEAEPIAVPGLVASRASLGLPHSSPFLGVVEAATRAGPDIIEAWDRIVCYLSAIIERDPARMHGDSLPKVEYTRTPSNEGLCGSDIIRRLKIIEKEAHELLVSTKDKLIDKSSTEHITHDHV